MRPIFLATVALLALSGCATNQQTGALAGAAVGAATGKVLGGQAGAAVGTVLGAAAGSNLGASMDARPSAVVVQAGPQPVQPIMVPQEQVYQVVPPGVVYVQPYWPAPYVGMSWIYVPRYGWGWHHPHRGFYYHRGHWR